MFFKTVSRILVFSLALSTGVFLPALAEDGWKYHQSKTTLFQMKLPIAPEEESASLRISPVHIVQSSEMIANIDQRPYKNAVKRYTGKVAQSFGPELTIKQRQQILNRALNRYQAEHEALGGVLRDRKIDPRGVGGEVFLSYEDQELGVQSVKAHVIVTESGQYDQILSVPDTIIDSAKSREFLESFMVEEDLTYSPGSMNDEWKKMESPFKAFTIKAPPVAHPYFPAPPTTQHSDKQEVVSLVFFDPLREEKLYYNVYGYRFDADMTFARATQVLMEKHVKRHNREPSSVKLHREFVDDRPALRTTYSVQSPKGFEYLNLVELRAVFIGNYMVVQEIMGSQALVNSLFIQQAADLFEFTPEKATKTYLVQQLQKRTK